MATSVTATRMPSTSLLVLVWIAALQTMDTSIAFSTLPSNIPINNHLRRPSSSPLLSSQQKEADDECLLLPETNPNSDPNSKSLSGVPYSSVVSGIDALYPPYELSSRNAKSRTDGYWKYVERGEKPPREFTYGEFDIDFFGGLLDRAWELYSDGGMDENEDENYSTTTTNNNAMDEEDSCSDLLLPWRDKTFCDIGSGAGRLVLTAAALHPQWKLCRGLEILEGLHNMSASIVDGCSSLDDNEDERESSKLGMDDDDDDDDDDNLHRILRIPSNDADESDDVASCNPDNDGDYLPLAPIKFTCGSFTDPYEYLGDIDCAFVFSSCMKPNLVRELSIAIGRQCKPGTIIITTEFPLFLRGNIDQGDDDTSMPHGPYEIQLLEKIDGWCWLLGGESTAYVHRVKTSLWEEYGGMPRDRPLPSLEEDAYRLVKLMENGELTDTEAFLRRVRNDMVFHGVPNEFLPHVDDDSIGD